MKLKEIKPGMVIHCKTGLEAEKLFSVLRNCGIKWLSGDDLMSTFFYEHADTGTCYFIDSENKLSRSSFEYFTNNTGKYGEIIPFSSLVIEEKTYEDGLNEAWAAAKKIVLRKEHGGLPCEDLEKTFEREPEWEVEYSVFKNLTPQEVISRLKSYEHEKNMRENIKVGDVVEHIRESNVKILVTAVYKNSFDGIKVGQSDECGKIGGCYSGSCFKDFERTGTNINISSILAEIGKE